ncbi:MAG: ribosome maturation factor RimP [Caulobacterales bacterium]|nr:ribosome maturation factor RimP [Caulobacterales bacterium]
MLEIIAPVAGDLAMAVVRVRVMGAAGRQRLQIMAERDDGTMGVEDCAALSRALSAVLDVEDPFDGEWDLEVSSPGVDRPLTERDHFARWQGFAARLELDRLVEGRKRFKGVLAGVEGDDVLMDLEGEADTAVIPFAWIAEARLVITDALLAESAKRRETEPGGPPAAEPDADAPGAKQEEET